MGLWSKTNIHAAWHGRKVFVWKSHLYRNSFLTLLSPPLGTCEERMREYGTLTLSSLSTEEQMVLNLSSGTPHTLNIPSRSFRWYTYNTSESDNNSQSESTTSHYFLCVEIHMLIYRTKLVRSMVVAHLRGDARLYKTAGWRMKDKNPQPSW